MSSDFDSERPDGAGRFAAAADAAASPARPAEGDLFTESQLVTIAKNAHIKITKEGVKTFYKQMQNNGWTYGREEEPVKNIGAVMNTWLKSNSQFRTDAEPENKAVKISIDDYEIFDPENDPLEDLELFEEMRGLMLEYIPAEMLEKYPGGRITLLSMTCHAGCMSDRLKDKLECYYLISFLDEDEEPQISKEIFSDNGRCSKYAKDIDDIYRDLRALYELYVEDPGYEYLYEDESKITALAECCPVNSLKTIREADICYDETQTLSFLKSYYKGYHWMNKKEWENSR